MKVRNAAKASPWLAVILALCLTAALAASASAAVSELTIDPVAKLSPGQLHVTITGTITCDAGSTPFLSGRIVQPRNGFGFGFTSVTCGGTAQPYSMDMSGGSESVFKPGKASAQVSTSQCDQTCTSKYTDATIRLTN